MMKKSFCKFLGIFLAVLMIAGAIPAAASAQEPADYNLWVNGEAFSADKTEIACGEGKAVFDAETSTLTLENAEVSLYSEHNDGGCALIYSELENLNIVLKGSNVLLPVEKKVGNGIITKGGCGVSFSGDGSLELSSSNIGMRIGSEGSEGGSLSFDGVTVKIVSSSTGIWAAKDISFKNSNVSVKAEGNFANAVISSTAGAITSTDSDVTLSAKRSAIRFGGGDTDMSAHTLTVNSGEFNVVSEKDYGIMFWNYRDPESGESGINGTINFNGGTLAVESQNGGTNLPEEDIFIADGYDYIEGESLCDSGRVVLGKAVPVTKYNLWVNGKQLTSRSPEIKCGEGTASFDSETSTLTLDNATILSAFEYRERSLALIYSEIKKLNIAVKGKCVFRDADSKGAEAIVCAGGCDIAVQGGDISVNDVYVGIRVGSAEIEGGSLSFDGTKIAITSSSTGMWVNKNISFNNSEATVTSTGMFSNAVISNIGGTVTVTNSSLTVSAKRAAFRFGDGDTDASAHALVVNAGELNVTSEKDYGVMVWNYRDAESGETKTNGTVTIKDGIVRFNTANGCTNLPQESVKIADKLYFTSGSSLADSGEVIIKAARYLALEPVAETPATCTEDGVKAHYSDGSARFSDKNGKKPVTDEDLRIPAKNHDWGEPSYEWSDDKTSVTATVTCKNDSAHTVSETVTTSSSEETPSDCEHNSVTAFKAEFENELFTTQTTPVENNDSGHIWGEPEYTWADDYGTATASVVCTRDSSHIFTETVRTTSTEVSAPDCALSGTVKYEAVFSDERFEPQTKTAEIPALGHSAVYVAAVPATVKSDGAVGYYKCERCGDMFSDEQCENKIEAVKIILAVSSIALSKTKFVYDGKVKNPSVKITDKAGNEIAAENFVLTYSAGRKNVGKHSAKVTFTGSYSGEKELAFTIAPKPTALKKLTPAKKKITVSFAKVTAQTTGYQIQYSLKKNFSAAKSKTIKSNKAVKTTLSSLKAKKTYYVRIRTYKTVGGAKYYSSWSKALKSKTK